MVKLTKIYTRTGDDGRTGLGSNQRVPKDDARVEAYGDVDEANAAIGVALALARRDPNAPIAALLESIQQDLFDLGADLCVPLEEGADRLRVTPDQTTRLEKAIDTHNEPLGPLTSFILPGGNDLAAALHVARCVTLMRAEPEATSAEPLRYLNRLSDLLFVLARVANDQGKSDILWKPGANR
jgi:cob(I)alamin adenosyltransferase